MGHHHVWYLQFRFRTLPNPCRALPFLFPPVQVPKFILLCLDNHPYRCYPHFPCNQIYLVLMKPSGRYWTWFYLVVCWFTFTLQNNATMHIPATTCLRLVVKHLCIANPGWDWVTPLVSWLKITFFFGWQFGVLHFQKSSSISHSLVGGLEHEFYFSIYWEEYSQLTNIFSDGLKPPTR
jgi:hypothetical protein